MPLVCIACDVAFEGVARAGLPCAYCLEPIVDVDAELARLAEGYDPVPWLLASLAVGAG